MYWCALERGGHPGRAVRPPPRAGPGAHRVLDDADAEDGVPLEELDTPTAREHARGDGSGGGHPHARGREGSEEGSEAAEAAEEVVVVEAEVAVVTTGTTTAITAL